MRQSTHFYLNQRLKHGEWRATSGYLVSGFPLPDPGVLVKVQVLVVVMVSIVVQVLARVLIQIPVVIEVVMTTMLIV